jgi:hypothetical protein
MHDARLLFARDIHDIEGKKLARYPRKEMFRCISIFSPKQRSMSLIILPLLVLLGSYSLPYPLSALDAPLLACSLTIPHTR